MLTFIFRSRPTASSEQDEERANEPLVRLLPAGLEVGTHINLFSSGFFRKKSVIKRNHNFSTSNYDFNNRPIRRLALRIIGPLATPQS
jgi:hypothetical protein